MNVTRLGWTLVHFLWQGTLIGGLYAAARSLVARNEARYLLACAALGIMMAAPVATWCVLASNDTTPAVAYDQTARVPHAVQTSATALPPAIRDAVPSTQQSPWLRWAVWIWLIGASALSLRLLGGWILAARMRWRMTREAPLEWRESMERLQSRLGVVRSVGLKVSAMVQSPVVIGAWRPLVLVPVGMLAGMPADQVEALLAHELAHIRRHDYLVNLLQSVAEALLFYHPAVWWVSGHIRIARENCCDDAAVAVSGDTMTYVSALAELAGSRSIRLAAVAANGGSVTDRIARLLGEQRPKRRGSLLGAALLAAASYAVFAQSAPRAEFQAASVKPNTDNPPNRMQRPFPGGRYTARNATLQMLMVSAYGVQPYQLIGGPSWMETEGFDIEAKADGDVPMTQIVLMLRSLLENRFKVTVHRDTKQLPTYDLTVAKGGATLQTTKGTCAPVDGPPAPSSFPCGMIRTGMSGMMEGQQVPLSKVVYSLASILGRPVIDHTGLDGDIDFHLKFTPDNSTQGLPGGALGTAPPDPDPSRPNIFEALQEQMGLKLTASKGPVEVIVIDHAERPTAN